MSFLILIDRWTGSSAEHNRRGNLGTSSTGPGLKSGHPDRNAEERSQAKLASVSSPSGGKWRSRELVVHGITTRSPDSGPWKNACTLHSDTREGLRSDTTRILGVTICRLSRPEQLERLSDELRTDQDLVGLTRPLGKQATTGRPECVQRNREALYSRASGLSGPARYSLGRCRLSSIPSWRTRPISTRPPSSVRYRRKCRGRCTFPMDFLTRSRLWRRW